MAQREARRRGNQASFPCKERKLNILPSMYRHCYTVAAACLQPSFAWSVIHASIIEPTCPSWDPSFNLLTHAILYRNAEGISWYRIGPMHDLTTTHTIDPSLILPLRIVRTGLKITTTHLSSTVRSAVQMTKFQLITSCLDLPASCDQDSLIASTNYSNKCEWKEFEIFFVILHSGIFHLHCIAIVTDALGVGSSLCPWTTTLMHLETLASRTTIVHESCPNVQLVPAYDLSWMFDTTINCERNLMRQFRLFKLVRNNDTLENTL
jgi:hypothetical protein